MNNFAKIVILAKEEKAALYCDISFENQAKEIKNQIYHL
jgi:hypothetical protein